MPNEYKLFIPIAGTQRRQADPRKKEAAKPPKEEEKVEEEEIDLTTSAPPVSPMESPKPEEVTPKSVSRKYSPHRDFTITDD